MNCPACDRPLNVGFELQHNHFIAWCGYGPCPSYKANDGASGRSEEQAQQNLIKQLNEKPDWDNDDR